MSKALASPSPQPISIRLADYYLKNEAELTHELMASLGELSGMRDSIVTEAAELVACVREDDVSISVFDKLLQEYDLSTHEGVQLMRLAEALIRTPDFSTRRRLIRDKIVNANWKSHAGESGSFFVNRATNGLQFSRWWSRISGGATASNVVSKVGDRALDVVMGQVMKSMGKHFVLGRSIEEALQQSEKSGSAAFSYDMLGESAKTDEDAQQYFEKYLDAINALANMTAHDASWTNRPGLSIKLSALHPRFEFAERDECTPVLVERMTQLCEIAAQAKLWINIDAEECDRTELTLDVFQSLLENDNFANWYGLGIVAQAYQRRAFVLIDHVIERAKRANRKIAVRLVKGAYWDSEIKRAQELGLEDYPVFTRKENTDLSYIACAKKLLAAGDSVFPQFATHNAHTAVAVARLSGGRPFEFQRLHGMGEGLHKLLSKRYGVISRVYAPVGQHMELLPYLVRRLLENGANSSFINQMFDERIEPHEVAADPLVSVQKNGTATHPNIPMPRKILAEERDVAAGYDLSQGRTSNQFENEVSEPTKIEAASIINGEMFGNKADNMFSPHNPEMVVGTMRSTPIEGVSMAVGIAKAANWNTDYSPNQRAEILNEAARLIEQDTMDFVNLCVWEAGKTIPDAIDEVREAVDFCRYYAAQLGLKHVGSRAPLGVVACISPWNFPLAIFLGQITAALSMGNTVVAKPPPQTPLIAFKAIEILHRAGVPKDVLHLLIGDGTELGTALTEHPDVDGMCFTGSTKTAQLIARNLARSDRLDVPYIAETGGINAMIVDSTSLLEQAVQDTIDSAFQSAGQRCSACRVVCVQIDIAADFVKMIQGTMQTLSIGDPSQLATDVGPVIDRASQTKIQEYVEDYRKKGRVIFECNHSNSSGNYVSPCIISMDSITELKEEIFGPVLHLVTFEGDQLETLLDDINSLGFGLTLGLHTRIDTTVAKVSSEARVGNLYVNRNQIGAVVGVQPFGGEGLSGTGPKAGGPHFQLRLSRPELVSNSDNAAVNIVQPNNQTFADSNRTDGILKHARRAVLGVSSRSLNTFAMLARSVFGDQNVADWVGDGRWSSVNLFAGTHLSGPTGEQNTLRLKPRGVLLALAHLSPSITVQRIFKCLSTGNACLLVRSAESELLFEKFSALLQEAGLPRGLLSLVSRSMIIPFIQIDIDGVVLDLEELRTYQNKIAEREGALLPILPTDSELWRFCVERTVSINTAAAGGDTSLFAKL